MVGGSGWGQRVQPCVLPWSAVPERTQAWYESKQRELANRIWQLHQEYPTTPEEAFIGSGNPVFNLDIIRMFQAEPGEEWTIQALLRRRLHCLRVAR